MGGLQSEKLESNFQDTPRKAGFGDPELGPKPYSLNVQGALAFSVAEAGIPSTRGLSGAVRV